MVNRPRTLGPNVLSIYRKKSWALDELFSPFTPPSVPMHKVIFMWVGGVR